MTFGQFYDALGHLPKPWRELDYTQIRLATMGENLIVIVHPHHEPLVWDVRSPMWRPLEPFVQSNGNT